MTGDPAGHQPFEFDDQLHELFSLLEAMRSAHDLAQTTGERTLAELVCAAVLHVANAIDTHLSRNPGIDSIRAWKQ